MAKTRKSRAKFKKPSAATSARMRAVGRMDTPPEVNLRKALWARGIRYRLGRKVAGTRPDIVLVGRRIAVFVDGCFWHGCPIHYSAPRSNTRFWSEKVSHNREKDMTHNAALRSEGWRVIRVWECQVNPDDSRTIRRVARFCSRLPGKS